MAATKKQAIYPEVLDQISNELRAVVNAYAYAKQALGLRQKSTEQIVAPIEWDSEDDAMLSGSICLPKEQDELSSW